MNNGQKNWDKCCPSEGIDWDRFWDNFKLSQSCPRKASKANGYMPGTDVPVDVPIVPNTIHTHLSLYLYREMMEWLSRILKKGEEK